MNLTGYRINLTGVFGYEYQDDRGRSVCSITGLVVPSPDVHIHCEGIDWVSSFDQESTIVPGLTRHIQEEETEREVFRIIYRQTGQYEIVKDSRCWSVLAEPDLYRFSLEGRCAATLERISRGAEADSLFREEERIPWLTLKTDDELPLETLVLFMSFPSLRFAF